MVVGAFEVVEPFFRTDVFGDGVAVGAVALFLGDGSGDCFGDATGFVDNLEVFGSNSSTLRILWCSSKLTRRGEVCFFRAEESSSFDDEIETLLLSSGITSKRCVYLPLLADLRGVELFEAIFFRFDGDRLDLSFRSSGDLMNLTPTSSGLAKASISRSAIMRSTLGLLPEVDRGLFSLE